MLSQITDLPMSLDGSDLVYIESLLDGGVRLLYSNGEEVLYDKHGVKIEDTQQKEQAKHQNNKRIISAL